MTDNTVVATYNGRDIEELIGFVEEEHPCVHCNVNGTLYAGGDGIAFLGKFFLFDKFVHFKWVDVKVQQTDHGVAIQTRTDEPIIHEFVGMHKPERVWNALMDLHNQALLDRTRSPGPNDETAVSSQSPSERAATAPLVHHRRKQLRRNTSDPNKLTPAVEELFAGAEKEEDTKSAPTTPEPKESVGRRASSIISNQASKFSNRASLLLSSKETEEVKTKVNIGVIEVSPESEIEAIVGKIQGEFPCFYNKQKGILYAGSTALYFVGGRLFFPAKISIQSSTIRQVQMIKGKPKSELESLSQSTEDAIKDQGIVICTRDGISHAFLGIESPDQVWASLVDMRNHVSAGPNSPRPFGMRRMNSDPNLQSKTGRELVSGVEQAGEGAKGEGAGHPEKDLAPPVRTEVELKEAWSQVMDKKNRFENSVVKDCEFACSLDRFYKECIADDAEFSIEKFMQTRQGDKDLKTSAWKSSEQDGKIIRKRVLRYTHPVNAPMAPPEAQARKEQTFNRFGDNGLTVETKTIVVGVPMTDCFFVKDRLIVAAAPGNKVLVSMEFELEFVKSTMFRGIITKTTNAEISKFCEQLRDFMAGSLGEEVAPSTTEPKKMEKEVVLETGLPYGLTPMKVTHILLASVLVMQFWLVLEMRSMKSSINRMEKYGAFGSK